MSLQRGELAQLLLLLLFMITIIVVVVVVDDFANIMEHAENSCAIVRPGFSISSLLMLGQNVVERIFAAARSSLSSVPCVLLLLSTSNEQLLESRAVNAGTPSTSS